MSLLSSDVASNLFVSVRASSCLEASLMMSSLSSPGAASLTPPEGEREGGEGEREREGEGGGRGRDVKREHIREETKYKVFTTPTCTFTLH